MTFSALAVAGVLLGQAAAPAPAATNAELLESAKLGQPARVAELLARGSNVNATDRRGFTPLMWACAAGNLQTVRQLIVGGAAVDRRATDGVTALMLAAVNGFTEVARSLISRGADVNASRAGIKARQLAGERGHVEVAALLEQAETLGNRLLRAAAEGNDTAVRQLLSEGAPVNISDEHGATALMIAARGGDLGIMQALLSRGADASAHDEQGHGVFEWAEPSTNTSKYVVAFLVDHGVSRDAPRRIATGEPPQVRASLDMLAAVLSRIALQSARLRTLQRRATTALSQLQALSASWPAESPDDYRDNLSSEVQALQSAIRTGDAETLAATVQAVAEDLEIKLEHCNRSGGKLGGSVAVRVRTVQGGDEIRNWQVFYMPRVFEAAANASPDLFPQLSSPTEDTLVPGRYVMWVRDPTSARVGERTIVKVGEGKKELVLDLPVPAAAPR
ncbi:MAG: ankyrin repeat domain-containing protein [Vicinamibacterales bacterium]